MLERNVRELADRPFIIAGDVTLTYEQFAEETARLAHVLAARGIGENDRVGLYLPSTPLMAIAFWACQRLGAIPCPISAMFRHNELRQVIARIGLKALVTDGRRETRLRNHVPRGEFQHHVSDCDLRARIAARAYLDQGRLIPLRLPSSTT